MNWADPMSRHFGIPANDEDHAPRITMAQVLAIVFAGWLIAGAIIVIVRDVL